MLKADGEVLNIDRLTLIRAPVRWIVVSVVAVFRGINPAITACGQPAIRITAIVFPIVAVVTVFPTLDGSIATALRSAIPAPLHRVVIVRT
tara:strand:- start:180 stop:452 length:273 start_codon:yes stop_codon:yes gene_type:complete